MSVKREMENAFVMQRKKIGFLHGFAGALVTTLAFGSCTLVLLQVGENQ